MIDNALSRRAILALAGLACIGVVGSATAATVSFKVPLIGAEQVPPGHAGPRKRRANMESEHPRRHLGHHRQWSDGDSHHGAFPQWRGRKEWTCGNLAHQERH